MSREVVGEPFLLPLPLFLWLAWAGPSEKRVTWGNRARLTI